MRDQLNDTIRLFDELISMDKNAYVSTVLAMARENPQLVVDSLLVLAYDYKLQQDCTNYHLDDLEGFVKYDKGDLC